MLAIQYSVIHVYRDDFSTLRSRVQIRKDENKNQALPIMIVIFIRVLRTIPARTSDLSHQQ